MDPPVDVTKLTASAQKILDAKSPLPLRKMGARGIAPGLRPHEALTVVALLSESEDESIAQSAKATLDKLPAPLLAGALTADLAVGVIDTIAPRYATNAEVMEKILALPQIALSTVARVASLASEAVAELIATNEERILKHVEIIAKLYLNKATRMSTADRLIELAVRNNLEVTGIPAFREAASAVTEELIAEPTLERNFDDEQFLETETVSNAIPFDPKEEDTHVLDEETGEEVVQNKIKPLYALIAGMSVSKKIRRAQVGNSSERMILVRDNDRRVATAAIKSPSVQENEVARISASRNVSEDVLRIIATDREWTRNHQVKLNLVANPRCPFAFAAKLIPHLRDHELKALARSKNVAGAVVQAAKQQLARKGVKV